jgi:hypothetical protein
MPNSGPIATLLAADLAAAFSGLFGTHRALRTGEIRLIVGQHEPPTLSLR